MQKIFKKVCTPVIVSMVGLGVVQTAFAYDEGDFIVKAGLAVVDPREESGNVLGNDDGVGVNSDKGVGISFTYMLSDQLGIEVLGALPFTHDVVGTGSLAGINIGEVKHLPPTISAQYYFPVSHQIQFFVGAGLNYTLFFEEDVDSELKAALGTNDVDLELDSSTGLALQIGADVELSKELGVSAGIYWVDLETEADVIVGGATAATVDLELDPWVYRLNLTYKL